MYIRREERNGGEEVRVKGFFYPFLNQLSTMQEIIKGDKKKTEKTGALENEMRHGRREDEGS